MVLPDPAQGFQRNRIPDISLCSLAVDNKMNHFFFLFWTKDLLIASFLDSYLDQTINKLINKDIFKAEFIKQGLRPSSRMK